MKKIILEIVYCVLSIIAFLLSIGIFNKEIFYDFYIYFTNISNYICFIIMYIELFLTIKNKKLKELNIFRFISTVMIIITFLIFNFVLIRNMTISQILSLESILMHVILPVIYVSHYLLYTDKKVVKKYYIFMPLLVALIYIIFIYIRAFLFNPIIKYPYFFLNTQLIGIKGVTIWLIILGLIIILISYIIFLINNKKDQK